MSAAVPSFTISSQRGILEGAGLAADVMRSQRLRLIDILRTLTDDEWLHESRCSVWTVHDVVRHLWDATRHAGAILRGETPPGVDVTTFDPRTTPVQWLADSMGQGPDETLDALAAATGELVEAVEARLPGDDVEIPFFYGIVHWSAPLLHVFWDGWVHERDVLFPLGRTQTCSAVEARAAAAYGLMLAGVPVAMVGTPLDEVVCLDGDGGGTFRVRVDNGESVVTACAEPTDDPLHGDLPDVVDSLVGREGELSTVLHGPPERLEPLGFFRAFMLTPS